FSKICAAADHSTSLVEIVDQLGNPPFGRFHYRLALSFSIVVFWIIGRHSTASQNCSVTRQLLIFTTDLIFSLRAQNTGTKGEDKTFWRLTERFSKICASADDSASLVEITDQLGDPPFGRFRRRLGQFFNIVIIWIIGRHGTASRNCSVTCRLLLFTVGLIFSFRAQHTGTKGEDKTFWRLAKRFR
ncbi:hypothetical protein MTR67_022749, partial [Solanum verrucosum]